MFWTIIIRTQRIYISHENSDKSQELAVFHDYKVIDTSTNMMSWVFIMIQFQNHILIWQTKSEIWYIDTTITRFVCEFEWWTNYKLISSLVIFRTIWKDMTCLHELWTQWKEN